MGFIASGNLGNKGFLSTESVNERSDSGENHGGSLLFIFKEIRILVVCKIEGIGSYFLIMLQGFSQQDKYQRPVIGSYQYDDNVIF